MKICVLIDAWYPIWGGGQTHVWELARLLAKKNKTNIDIYTRALVGTDGNRYINNERYCWGKLNLYRVGPLTSFFNLYGRLAWLIKVVYSVINNHRFKKYQVIHAHAYSAGIPGKILSILLGIPVVFTVHGSNNLDLKKRNLISYAEKFILTKIKYNHVISVSRSFLQYSNINAGNISVIPNGVDIGKFNKPRLINKTNYFRLLCVARFDPVKGIHVLLHALAKVVKENPYIHLRLVGDGRAGIKLRQLVSELGITSHVTFCGDLYDDKLVNEYLQADLFILPSLSEGMSITLLEAWAAKLPVIVTDVGSNREVVLNGKNGYLIAPNDVNELSQVIIKAMRNRSLSSLGINGFHNIKTKFTWEIAGVKIDKIYQKTISNYAIS